MPAPEGDERDLRVLEPLTGCVLAGGRSSRMGRDKAWIAIAEAGPTLAVLQVARLRRIFAHVIVSANDREAFAPLDVSVVPDRGGPGAGPLAGIAAAVAAAETGHVFCGAVDMPFLAEPLVRYLASLATPAFDIVVPRGERGGFEPLLAVYGKRCVVAFDRRLAAGERKIDRAFADPTLRVRIVEPEEVLRLDPAARSFRNVNTPEDLDEVRREWNALAGAEARTS